MSPQRTWLRTDCLNDNPRQIRASAGQEETNPHRATQALGAHRAWRASMVSLSASLLSRLRKFGAHQVCFRDGLCATEHLRAAAWTWGLAAAEVWLRFWWQGRKSRWARGQLCSPGESQVAEVWEQTWVTSALIKYSCFNLSQLLEEHREGAAGQLHSEGPSQLPLGSPAVANHGMQLW